MHVIKLMKTLPHIFPAPVEEMLWAYQTHIPVIEPLGCFGLLSLDDSLPLGEDSGNSHGRMKGFMSCVPGDVRKKGRRRGRAVERFGVQCCPLALGKNTEWKTLDPPVSGQSRAGPLYRAPRGPQESQLHVLTKSVSPFTAET